MEPTDLSAEIATTAQEPASAQTDAGQAATQPLPALIQADQYLAKKRVARKRGLFGMISVAKLNPPGAVGDSC